MSTSEMQERVRRTRDLVTAASIEHEIMNHGDGWIAIEQRRRGIAAVATQLAPLWAYDAQGAMRSLDVVVERVPRAFMRAINRHHPDALGCAIPSEHRTYLVDDLDRAKEREVAAHELAHHLFTIAADGTEEGEETAHAFKDAWLLARDYAVISRGAVVINAEAAALRAELAPPFADVEAQRVGLVQHSPSRSPKPKAKRQLSQREWDALFADVDGVFHMLEDCGVLRRRRGRLVQAIGGHRGRALRYQPASRMNYQRQPHR